MNIMGVSYQWADDKKIIMEIVIEAPWTWQEYMAQLKPIMAQVSEGDTPRATLVDVSKMGAMPRDGNIIQNLLYVDKVMPKNVFASSMVGAPALVVAFMNVLVKLRPSAKRLVAFSKTREDGHALIYERYNKLYPAKPLIDDKDNPSNDPV
jgi:hypothetical protein